MRIIEFLGIARSGKTTVAKALEEKFPNVTYYPERHDLVPAEVFGKNFEHNFWYAKYCVETLKSISSKGGLHIFERGIVDRVVIGRVYRKMNWFSEEQLKEYEGLLNQHIHRIDRVFVFLVPINESVVRAERVGKDVTKAIPYMNNLYAEYKNLGGQMDNCVYLPEGATVEELESLVTKEIGL